MKEISRTCIRGVYEKCIQFYLEDLKENIAWKT
jgi:hypothetical protein